jgi:hypothetical protein
VVKNNLIGPRYLLQFWFAVGGEKLKTLNVGHTCMTKSGELMNYSVFLIDLSGKPATTTKNSDALVRAILMTASNDFAYQTA